MHDPARLHVSRLGNPKAPPLEPATGAEQPSASMATLLQARPSNAPASSTPVIVGSPGELVETASFTPRSVPAI